MAAAYGEATASEVPLGLLHPAGEGMVALTTVLGLRVLGATLSPWGTQPVQATSWDTEDSQPLLLSMGAQRQEPPMLPGKGERLRVTHGDSGQGVEGVFPRVSMSPYCFSRLFSRGSSVP